MSEAELLTKLRRLGEKYYGNALYGEHLQYQHELQELIQQEIAKARIDELRMLTGWQVSSDFGDQHGLVLGRHKRSYDDRIEALKKGES